MITINAKTKEVRNAREHEPQMRSEWFPEYNTTPGYIRGWTKPNYPVPAIPLDVGPPMCRGLLGTCVYCIWPVCEYKT